MENKEVKVSKLEDILDNCSIATKMVAAGIGIVSGIIGVIYGVRTIKMKNSNPDLYWRMKRNAISEGHRAIAKGLEDIAEAMRKN